MTKATTAADVAEWIKQILQDAREGRRISDERQKQAATALKWLKDGKITIV